MDGLLRVELVWVDCYCDDHLEYFTCLASAVHDVSRDVMHCISAMPTFLNFKTLSLFRLEDYCDVSKIDADEV